MTLEETIEKVEKMFADEVEKEHDELAREYAHVLMFLRNLKSMEDIKKDFNEELNGIVSKNEKFTEGLADIVQACMRNKRKEVHIDLNFECDDGEYAPVKVTISIED